MFPFWIENAHKPPWFDKNVNPYVKPCMYVWCTTNLLIITELLLLLDTNYFLMLYYVYFCERTLENQKTTAIVIRLWPKNLNKNTLNKKNNIRLNIHSYYFVGSFMNVRSQLIWRDTQKKKTSSLTHWVWMNG